MLNTCKRLFKRITGKRAKLAAEVRNAFEMMPDAWTSPTVAFQPPTVGAAVLCAYDASAEPRTGFVEGDAWITENSYGGRMYCIYLNGAVRRTPIL